MTSLAESSNTLLPVILFFIFVATFRHFASFYFILSPQQG
jgi:hypothetical protein